MGALRSRFSFCAAAIATTARIAVFRIGTSTTSSRTRTGTSGLRFLIIVWNLLTTMHP